MTLAILTLAFHLVAAAVGFRCRNWGDEHGYHLQAAIGLFVAVGAVVLATFDAISIYEMI